MKQFVYKKVQNSSLKQSVDNFLLINSKKKNNNYNNQIFLQKCSQDLNIIYKDKGAICMKCCTFYKIYSSYLLHLKKCISIQ